MFAATISSTNTTLRIPGGSSIIVRRLDRAKAEDEECNRRNGAAGAVNSENIQSLSLHALQPSGANFDARITLQPQIAAWALCKSRYIFCRSRFQRRLVKALLRGANHIEITLNLIRWDWTCGISPKSRRPDHINESWPRSDKADPSALKRDSRKLRGPFFACGDGKGTRGRSSRHDFARAERRTELILRQRFGDGATRTEARRGRWPRPRDQ
jgi:hypothetical protein